MHYKRDRIYGDIANQIFTGYCCGRWWLVHIGFYKGLDKSSVFLRGGSKYRGHVSAVMSQNSFKMPTCEYNGFINRLRSTFTNKLFDFQYLRSFRRLECLWFSSKNVERYEVFTALMTWQLWVRYVRFGLVVLYNSKAKIQEMNNDSNGNMSQQKIYVIETWNWPGPTFSSLFAKKYVNKFLNGTLNLTWRSIL